MKSKQEVACAVVTPAPIEVDIGNQPKTTPALFICTSKYNHITNLKSIHPFEVEMVAMKFGQRDVMTDRWTDKVVPICNQLFEWQYNKYVLLVILS